MENTNDVIKKFPMNDVEQNINRDLSEIAKSSLAFANDANALQSMFNAIDLTSLNSSDTELSIKNFVEKVNSFAIDYPNLKNVGGICVYPKFASTLNSTLKLNNIFKAVVAACFPSSQTFIDIKCAEVKEAVKLGANEIDIVISVGSMIEGDFDTVSNEISQLKKAAEPARLKVILETGTLEKPSIIWNASILAMNAGADMIKTSTGKNGVGATPEAAYIMCKAIKSFYEKTGKKIGFKPAGGVRSVEDACLNYNIVKTILGNEWLTPKLFRIGASGLANALLNQILKVTTNNDCSIKYF